MNDSTKPHTDEFGNPIPVRPIQVRFARVAIVGAVILLVWLQFLRGTAVTIERQGDSTIYTAHSPIAFMVYVFPVFTAVLTIVYVFQPGIFRVFGAVLGLMTAWLIVSAVTMDLSNHNVTVTPTSVSREVGTKSNPIRRQIDFTTTAYLYIDHVSGGRGLEYELVANAVADGAETRIPIYDMMRSALPQIMETAGKHDVIIGPSEDGSVIPAALRVDAGK
jgi:hypothetical protein